MKRLEVECDSGAAAIKVGRAWFECGSHSNNLWLAMVARWTERRNAKERGSAHNACIEISQALGFSRTLGFTSSLVQTVLPDDASS
jgi:hypothetical protein